MLSLCGSVDPASNKTTVGIDTTTGALLQAGW